MEFHWCISKALRAPLWFRPISSRPTYNNIQLIEEADKTLCIIRHNPLHILHPLLPKQIDNCYSLRPRSHNFEVTHNHDNIRNFIDRMLFRNVDAWLAGWQHSVVVAGWLAGCLSHASRPIVSKRLNIIKNFFKHLVAPSF